MNLHTSSSQPYRRNVINWNGEGFGSPLPQDQRYNMPNKTELRKMTKPQLVDFGCTFFADDSGNLRQELDEMLKDDLLEMLFKHEAHVEEETPEVEVSVKLGPVSSTDLGNW